MHQRVEHLVCAGVVSHVLSHAVERDAGRVQTFQERRFAVELVRELSLRNHQPGVRTCRLDQVCRSSARVARQPVAGSGSPVAASSLSAAESSVEDDIAAESNLGVG